MRGHLVQQSGCVRLCPPQEQDPQALCLPRRDVTEAHQAALGQPLHPTQPSQASLLRLATQGGISHPPFLWPSAS